MIEKSSNKLIMKNAAVLYFRMLITVLVGLYTSRVILQALGVEDFGIYNVVGGFVSLFSIISASISASIVRYLTFSLGKGDALELRRVFSMSILVLCGISLIIVLATETIGLWYIYNKMVVPTSRMNAAFWVFQISIITFIVSLINVPYNSTIVAHERMPVYAYLSIVNAVLKLLICFAVSYSSFDRLIVYAFLLLIVTVLNQIFHVWFCKKNFEECRFRLSLEKKLFKEMFGFAGWKFIGTSASILRVQGTNLLLNWVGGPIVNCAYGIANTVSGVVSGFVGNFTQAFNPQITKRYAAEEYESLMQLLIYGAKYSYYLMFILVLPLSLNMEFVLKLWLGEVPDYTVNFCCLTCVFLLSETISYPIITAKNATGKIRDYQLIVGGIQLLTLPISYIGLKLGFPLEYVVVSTVFTSIIALVARLYSLQGDFPSWSVTLFVKKVVLNVLIVSLVSTIPSIIVFLNIPNGWCNFILTSLISVGCTTLTIFYIGCSKSERKQIILFIKRVSFVKKKSIS